MASVNMRFAEVTKSSTPEVLKRMLGAEYLKPIVLDSTAFTNGVCAAGTAVTEDGTLSAGDGSDVYGILLNDVYSDNPNGSAIVASAVINGSNSTATSDDRTALAAKVVIFE